MAEETPEKRSGFFQRLKEKLVKTKQSFIQKIKNTIRLRGKVDEEMLEELEEILIQADIGPETALRLVDGLRKNRDAKGEADSEKLIALLKEGMLDILGREPRPLDFSSGPTPRVVLVVGVNGTGKTTSIGKIAQRLAADGKKTILAAGDTFRAAAIDQLEIWAARTGSEIIKQAPGSDPSSVCFDAMTAARQRGADAVIIDTAGRLHTKNSLMEELKKIVRVIQKHDPTAPHETLLVLDATTGQNALSQARVFSEAVPITGLAMTKLDGTAKGGILIALSDQFKIPIRMIGVGEGPDDYRDFSPRDFVDALFEE
ncbi:MAG: Signal recognition particle receptor FtsY [candidate division BRC1 bacterium ADurb.BinA364]|nr:MAG: Signal recognition particle receptor FtsY [candidate division BRC1 bacterium ADurb.BinA364]